MRVSVMPSALRIRLSLIFLGLIPVVGLALGIISTKAHPIFERVFDKYDELNNVVEENVRGIRVIKSLSNNSYKPLALK